MAKVEELPVVEGYEAEKKTISMLKANVLSVVLTCLSRHLGYRKFGYFIRKVFTV